MGLTLIRKSDGTQPKRNPKVALVLAGGAVSGGAFKVGGLKALNDFLVGRKIVDFDMYLGISAGSLLAVSLSAGITPDEMIAVLEGSSARFKQLGPLDFYNPNWREFSVRPAKFGYDLLSYLPGIALDLARSLTGLPAAIQPAVRSFVREPTYTHFEALAIRLREHVSPRREFPSPTNHIPTGLFDSKGLEEWLRENLDRIGMPNDFRAFRKKRGNSLYLTACDLDTAERAIFGYDENADVAISEGVQASTALPIFYKPARIHGIDYVDGGVRNTANIDIAIEKGADLIVCYNPFRPFLNRIDSEGDESAYFSEGRYIADRGMKAVMNQVFRTLLHSRLKLGIQRYLTDDRFQGDIILLEPRELDAEFFGMNPLAFWKREQAVEHGFESVRLTIEQNFDQLRSVLAVYGLRMNRGAARRKAERARVARGWSGEVSQKDSQAGARRALRLVGSEGA